LPRTPFSTRRTSRSFIISSTSCRNERIRAYFTAHAIAPDK
jgi:hypothetical protein